MGFNVVSHLVAVLLAVTQPVPPVAPVRGTVIDGFRAPACQRCAGHRGVTIATSAGAQVRAVSSGVIVFVGRVARVLYVVNHAGDVARHILYVYVALNICTCGRPSTGMWRTTYGYALRADPHGPYHTIISLQSQTEMPHV